MKLFHGSNMEIEQVDFTLCRPYKDFGKGFYCTTIYDQAIAMAKRVARIYGGEPVITEYELDDTALRSDLTVRSFEEPTMAWAMFIMNNRSREYTDFANSECNHDLKYDIVIGPIANDDLALLFRTFANGLITVETLVKEMEYKKLTVQYSFHTPKAVAHLVKTGVRHV